MQQSLGGITGPEGPGWPRFDLDSPSRSGLVYLPELVRDHFIDEHAEEAAGTGKLWPQGTQCLVDDGDVILTMHSIPHSGSRNEWDTPRMNMIWRIRSKKRQPNFVHNGGTYSGNMYAQQKPQFAPVFGLNYAYIFPGVGTDHPDRLGMGGPNGEWMEFAQDEPPYYPGEVGNDPHARSKYALSHIWHEWEARTQAPPTSI